MLRCGNRMVCIPTLERGNEKCNFGLNFELEWRMPNNQIKFFVLCSWFLAISGQLFDLLIKLGRNTKKGHFSGKGCFSFNMLI